jgi:hypothetical protein
MKRTLLLVLFTAGLVLPAIPAQAATQILAAPRSHGHGGFRGGHSRVIVGFGWGGWGGWGWGWGYPYYPYYGYPGYYAYEGYGPGGYYGAPAWARVKTDVDPEEARIYLDGQLIGTADDFDGWPDYLYLKRGHYRLEFRLNGYETRTVEVDARPGQTLRIDDHLKKIPGAKQRGSYDDPKIEGGIRRFWAKRGNAAEPASPYARREEGPSRDYDREDDGYGPDRPPARQPESRNEDWREDRRSPRETAEGSRTERGSKGRVRLHVEPPDAAVYLDDRFVGTAEEINSLDRGIAVSPGRHTVTVSRPGFKDRNVEVDVRTGESERIEVSLSR